MKRQKETVAVGDIKKQICTREMIVARHEKNLLIFPILGSQRNGLVVRQDQANIVKWHERYQ